MKILNNYQFPGNVRELLNIVEYAVNICESRYIEPEHLPAYITEQEESAVEETMPLISEPDRTADPGFQSVTTNNQKNWASMEKEMIMNALLESSGRKSDAAEKLGWGRSTLWRKMKKYGLI